MYSESGGQTQPHKEITTEFSDVFEGIGRLPGKHKIQLKGNAEPVIHPARKVPFTLRDRLKDELDRLTEQ